MSYFLWFWSAIWARCVHNRFDGRSNVTDTDKTVYLHRASLCECDFKIPPFPSLLHDVSKQDVSISTGSRQLSAICRPGQAEQTSCARLLQRVRPLRDRQREDAWVRWVFQRYNAFWTLWAVRWCCDQTTKANYLATIMIWCFSITSANCIVPSFKAFGDPQRLVNNDLKLACAPSHDFRRLEYSVPFSRPSKFKTCTSF